MFAICKSKGIEFYAIQVVQTVLCDVSADWCDSVARICDETGTAG